MSEQKRRRSDNCRHKSSVFKAFRFEFLAAGLFALGLFLLLEDMEIKETLFKGIVGSFKAISNGFFGFIKNIQNLAQKFEVSDIIGFVFIVIAMIMISFRTRSKMIERYAELDECPDCGGELNHIHRQRNHRMLAWFMYVKVRHYHCKECGYKGIRMRRHTHHRS